MRKIAVILFILLFAFGGLVIAEEDVKVPFNAVKSSCYGKIDMSKAEFPLSEIGKECVEKNWLEANLSETENAEEDTDTEEEGVKDEKKESSELEELKANIKRILHDEMDKTVIWDETRKTLKEINLIKQVDYEEDVYLAKISYRVNSHFGREGAIKNEMFEEAMDFSRKFFSSPHTAPVVECMLMPELKLVDNYGNTSEEQVAKIVVSRDLAEKINWENMYYSRFRDLVEDEGQLWLHSAIRE